MHFRIFTKAAAFILLLVLADILLVSCYKSKTYNYKHVRAHLDIMEADSTGHERYLGGDGESVDAKKLFMDVHLSSDIIAKANVAPAMLIGSAMAMQPNADYYINKSRLKSIKVTTLANYNAKYPANSDFTANCAFGFGLPRHSSETFTAEKFVEKYNAHIQENEKISDAHIPTAMFWFRLHESTQSQDLNQLKITIEMEDGSVLDAESLRFRISQ